MADLALAVSFVRDHGNPLEQARLWYITMRVSPAPDAVDSFLGDQRPDGSWAALWTPDRGSLDATCFYLTQAEEFGLDRANPSIARAAEFLAERQKADGSWEEDEAFAWQAPPRVKPGDERARLYLAAECGPVASAGPHFWADQCAGARLAMRRCCSCSTFPAKSRS